jgi:bifunctional DNA-binding transcriptional regulator/antitoxin component of YhaV-PrlF toxin-antitoxin module
METFRVKVAARRQVTLPQELLELLHLGEGDVLELCVEGGSFRGRGLRLVPTDIFTPELLRQIREREQEMTDGSSLEVEHGRELASKLRRRPVAAGSRV